jgi:hypothetical protein
MKVKFSFTWMVLFMAAFILSACGGQAASAQGFGTDEFIEALSDQGVDTEKGAPVEQAFFSVTGSFINFDSDSVQVFEYDSAEAMENDAALIAPDGGSIGTSMVHWVAPPHFYKKGRLLVLYTGENTDTLKLLETVLGSQFAGR